MSKSDIRFEKSYSSYVICGSSELNHPTKTRESFRAMNLQDRKQTILDFDLWNIDVYVKATKEHVNWEYAETNAREARQNLQQLIIPEYRHQQNTAHKSKGKQAKKAYTFQWQIPKQRESTTCKQLYANCRKYYWKSVTQTKVVNIGTCKRLNASKLWLWDKLLCHKCNFECH